MPPLVLREDEVQLLRSLANSLSLPHSIVQRAQIVLACEAGETTMAIAKRLGLTGMTLGQWRKRYRALQTKPTDGSTQWCARSVAAATGISKSIIHRKLQTFSVQPHR